LPTKRTRLARGRISGEPTDTVWRWLTDEGEPAEPEGDQFERFMLAGRRDLWEAYEGRVISAWARPYPGTRPSLWWKWSAPRWAVEGMPERWRDVWFATDLPEPRRRVGGVGTPSYECLAVVPNFAYGIPASWLTAELRAYYKGRIRAPAYDPDDPPTYEAQASYLERHKLFLPGERARSDFTPEIVLIGKGESVDRG
jgi:hypothetical protein